MLPYPISGYHNPLSYRTLHAICSNAPVLGGGVAEPAAGDSSAAPLPLLPSDRLAAAAAVVDPRIVASEDG